MKINKENKFKDITEYLTIVLLTVVSIGLASFIKMQLPTVTVSGHSMEPTFTDGEKLLTERVNKDTILSYGDIVVFKKGFAYLCIKRVIGLPGDTVEITDDGVMVNGELLDEPYIQGETASLNPMWQKVTLSDDEYYLMGDNREHSTDCRAWGPIKKGEIIKKFVSVKNSSRERL